RTFLPVFENTPPPAPAVLAGAGALPEHALAPSIPLAWSPVQDPEGDPTTYSVYLGTAPAALSRLQQGGGTSAAVPGPSFATTYYWEVSAMNPYGGASTTPVEAVEALLADQPPSAFDVTAGSGTLQTRASTQTLAWGTAADPDGDAVTYALRLSTDPAALALVQESSATSFPLSFQFGSTYYWTVTALDGYGGATAVGGGLQTFLPLFLDEPPAAPNIVAPFNGSPVVKTMHDSVSVSWGAVSDPQGDPITYTVYFGKSRQEMTPLATIAQAAGGASAPLGWRPLAAAPAATVAADSGTVTLTLSGLAYYQPYFLQVAAANPYGAVAQAPLATFTLSSTDGFPKAYNYPNPFSPERGGTNIVFNAPPSGYARATVEVYSEWQGLLFKQDYANIPPGVSQVRFGGRDRYGRALFNGSYICRVRFDGPSDSQVFYMLVVK
ncbi:MAG: hypothetical protein KGL53_07380, partial [Elusimicrobia bacterium]|nr:hypothetical protein [Elusimicrobiota bacterium]